MIVIRRVWIAAFVLALAGLTAIRISASPIAGQDSPIANPSPADVEQGKQIFETRCSTCHGLDGGGAMGPNIQAIPMRLGAPAVESVIKNGMSGGMPAFAGQVNATEIQQIIAYLMTLK